MRIDGIIWLEEVERKIWEKHRVQPDEVEAVLESNPHVRFVERGFRQGEGRLLLCAGPDTRRTILDNVLHL